ncbi:MAG: DUF5683 domain-containing protein, partial [Bacteroidota bacterium]
MDLKCLVVLFLFSTPYALLAQQSSNSNVIPKDSLGLAIEAALDLEKSQDYPNPKRAAILSLAIPGAGHIYNKKYWKAPLTWAALGVAVFFVDRNTKTYRLLQESYCDVLGRENNLSRENNPCNYPRSVSFLTSNSGSTSTEPYSISPPNWQALYTTISTRTSTQIRPLRDTYDKYRQLSWISIAGIQLLSGMWSFVDSHFLDFDTSEDLSWRMQPSLES